jgi:hypothetical protein
MLRSLLALAFAGAAMGAFAQGLPTENPDWKELDAPPPPALRTEGLIAFDVPSSTLRYGVDPASISVGRDGVVRYVVVASSSSGAVNAMYEGLRCGTGDVKTYARHTPGAGWSAVRQSDWQRLQTTGTTRHSMFIARAGACRNHAPNISPAQIVRDLKAPMDLRFDGPPR